MRGVGCWGSEGKRREKEMGREREREREREMGGGVLGE